MLSPTDLKQFTGTENYFKSPNSKLVYTDGARYLFQNGGNDGAYWLRDHITFSIFPFIQDSDFSVIEVDVKDNKATIKVQDGNGNYIKHLTHAIEYTDLSDGEYRLWIESGECGGRPVKVMMVPSER